MNNSNSKGQFKKGTSGNPAGRPRGSRNEAMLVYEQMLREAGPRLLAKQIELGLDGNVQALRDSLGPVFSALKKPPVEFSLQPIESAADLPRAFRELTIAATEGRLPIPEAEKMANFLKIQAEVLKTVDLEQRVREIEKVEPDVIKYQAELHRYIANDVKLRKAEAAKQAADDEEEESKR
jgi:hypothetical protein